jgi:hypothetical protein
MSTKYRFTILKPSCEIEIVNSLDSPINGDMQDLIAELKDALFDHRTVDHPLLQGAMVIKYELTVE